MPVSVFIRAFTFSLGVLALLPLILIASRFDDNPPDVNFVVFFVLAAWVFYTAGIFTGLGICKTDAGEESR